MNIIRPTLDIDAGTDARLRELAAERGQDISAVLAEAVALLDSVVDIAIPTSRKTAADWTRSSARAKRFHCIR